MINLLYNEVLIDASIHKTDSVIVLMNDKCISFIDCTFVNFSSKFSNKVEHGVSDWLHSLIKKVIQQTIITSVIFKTLLNSV